MTSNQTVLDVREVRLSYGNVQALDNVSFNISRGSLTALIGPNGAGKSSIVKAICGRIAFDAGQIEINGINIKERSARATLGVAPQRPALYDHLTAFENLFSFARQSGLPKSDALEHVESVLPIIGFDKSDRRLAKHMSGGMRQRINIGGAIVHRPTLVILDEPAAGLDPSALKQINSLIASLKNEGFGILLITHDMPQAAQLADQVTVLEQGKICAQGTPRQLVSKYFQNDIRLKVASTHASILERHGFQPDPDDTDFHLSYLPEEGAALLKINALMDAGIGLKNIEISTPDLHDAMSAAVKKQNARGAVE